MKRYFNTEGRCRPDKHYMVRLDDRLDKIKRLFVDRGKYFVINRGRQYGKTTTLMALAEYLKDDYAVISMDFQMMSSANFADEETFVVAFLEYLEDVFSIRKELGDYVDRETFCNLISLKDSQRVSMDRLFRGLSRMCRTSKKPLVLIIDEVDNASNYRVFLDFLALLRGYYLNRDNSPALHCVILAGVYDIKNLKLKLRPEEEYQYNSPWNIAADFSIDMSFSEEQITDMLDEYEKDNHTGMDTETVAQEIYQYTSGYPYLVSAICKILDEELPGHKRFSENRGIWTREGIGEAVKIILTSGTLLFDSMVKQLDTFKDLKNVIQEILYQGKKIPFSPGERAINLGRMFGFLREDHGSVAITNRIFEMFLFINGAGNYYIEAQTRDARRTDVIVDYLGEQFIVELKIWHGSEYHEQGRQQLTEYLDYYHQDKGYLLSFNFNKKKEQGIRTIRIGNKTIVEAVV